jgi:GDP-L-fucose synthase
VDKDSKIFVAGHGGMVGASIVRTLKAEGFTNILTASRAELDLTDQMAVRSWFDGQSIDHVILAAAKVGGILANNEYRGQFLYENLMIAANVIDEAYKHDVPRLMFLGSSCIYPRDCPQPMKEEYLLTGPLEQTNEPYAIAKIAGLKLCETYNAQYGTNYVSLMPTNLYGIGDNFDLQGSHVLPAMIRKVHDAKEANVAEIVVWGTGEPKREFLWADDLAEAAVFLMGHNECPALINVGSGQEISIGQLARLVCDVLDYQGEIVFDHDKPDGTPRKLLDCSRLSDLGWEARTPLREGISLTHQWYLENLA